MRDVAQVDEHLLKLADACEAGSNPVREEGERGERKGRTFVNDVEQLPKLFDLIEEGLGRATGLGYMRERSGRLEREKKKRRTSRRLRKHPLRLRDPAMRHRRSLPDPLVREQPVGRNVLTKAVLKNRLDVLAREVGHDVVAKVVLEVAVGDERLLASGGGGDGVAGLRENEKSMS